MGTIAVGPLWTKREREWIKASSALVADQKVTGEDGKYRPEVGWAPE